ncbi:putative Late nodulin [Medicago truncatula]|uniref:Nodule Cysteine-Rich (NCR) secreted peptide n=1 Tax=Medicago truncatula TaxID=3880 RepID=A0A072UWC9_MEDTR|nr:Nodule Cysteine-Rich (NCR) secreted peptide [Medicago truncatula]RHN61010.1 putative Late nodulin [Medicago truncatula]
MTKVLNLVYVMIIFIFLFFVVANTETYVLCFYDSDCPQDKCKNPDDVPRCIFPVCHCIKS